MSARVAIIYYSSTGHVHRLAQAVAEGAARAGADARLRRVAELAPAAAIDANPAWAAHARATRGIPEATHDDLRWADGFAFGTPARFGTPAAQLKQFIDTTGGLWRAGDLTDKPVTVFASAQNPNGGMEATILSLSNVFYHWGSVLVPPGYTHDAMTAAGGNPYGTTYASDGRGADIQLALAAARQQGARLALYASAIARLRAPEHDRVLAAG
ncbi:MAG TPA: NAD(P)H:quinone oxidoreductase [Acidimicrobiia bacterium]|nr:NAD(P)H:quinone oxidoreductase [Acidimicrobiia bacterium]